MHVHVLGTLYQVSFSSVVYINDDWQRFWLAYQDCVGRTPTDDIIHQSINQSIIFVTSAQIMSK
jgi:hypothetical protein